MNDLIGQKVLHKVFGVGIIYEYTKKEDENNFNFLVSFNERKVEFKFPDAFEKFLTAVDNELQNTINELLKEKMLNEKIFKLQEEVIDLEDARRFKIYKNKTFIDKGNLKGNFTEWLIERGYKELTPAGLPSTVPQYVGSIEKVIQWESLLGWNDVADNIYEYIHIYDIGGSKEKFGKSSHNTVISALRRFYEFLSDL